MSYSLPLPPLKAYHAAAKGTIHLPVHGGLMVYNEKKQSMGTLGGVVKKGGQTYLMSAQHVFAASPSALNIVPAGIYLYDYNLIISGQGIRSSKPIGVTIAFQLPARTSKTVPYMDVALAKPLVPAISDIPSIGAPTGVVAPRVGMKVVKYGGNTGLTTGTITKTNVNIPLSREYLKDVFHVKAIQGYSKGGVNHFSDAGDSGCFVLEQGSRKVVGILVMGSEDGLGICCRADAVASHFGISFVSSAFTPAGSAAIPVQIPTSAGTLTSTPSSEIDNPLLALIQAILDFILGFLKGFTK